MTKFDRTDWKMVDSTLSNIGYSKWTDPEGEVHLMVETLITKAGFSSKGIPFIVLRHDKERVTSSDCKMTPLDFVCRVKRIVGKEDKFIFSAIKTMPVCVTVDSGTLIVISNDRQWSLQVRNS